MHQLKTYAEWLREGAAVIKGAKAAFYRVSPDGTEGVAVFAVEQTQPLVEDPAQHWTTVVPTEEWRASKSPSKEQRRPTVRVGPITNDGSGVSIWCGSEPTVLKMVQRSQYTYNPRTRRWVHIDRSCDDVIAGLRSMEKFNVVDERQTA